MFVSRNTQPQHRRKETRPREQTLHMRKENYLLKIQIASEIAPGHILEKPLQKELAMTFAFMFLSVTLEFLSLKFRRDLLKSKAVT